MGPRYRPMFTQMEGGPTRSVRQSQRPRSANGPKASGATLWSVLAHAGPVPLPKLWVAEGAVGGSGSAGD